MNNEILRLSRLFLALKAANAWHLAEFVRELILELEANPGKEPGSRKPFPY